MCSTSSTRPRPTPSSPRATCSPTASARWSARGPPCGTQPPRGYLRPIRPPARPASARPSLGRPPLSRPASADQPLGPRWPAIPALLSTSYYLLLTTHYSLLREATFKYVYSTEELAVSGEVAVARVKAALAWRDEATEAKI
eukprot:scaffold56399_cov54-Phaeocystis_antarctica.AAC.5